MITLVLIVAGRVASVIVASRLALVRITLPHGTGD